jgi:hypothetical protein
MHTPPFFRILVIAMVASQFLSACANGPIHTGVPRNRQHPGKTDDSNGSSKPAPTPTSTPLPEQDGQPTSEIHVQQLTLIKGIAQESFSVEQAKEVLTEFAPPSFDVSGDPKKRLHVLISRTNDPKVLSEMGEKIPH